MTAPDDGPGLDRFDLTSLANDQLRGRQDAEDVAQDVWLLLRRQSPDRVRGLAAWLKLAIRHIAVRSRERDRRRSERERIVARPDRAPSVVEQLERKSLQELLNALVDELREPYREVVRLRYLEDREIEEIAARFGRSPGTVRSQLTRGLDQLRARLGVEPRRGRKLLALFPWPWRRAAERSDRRIGTGPALVFGSAAAVVVIGVLSIDARSVPEELAAAASRVEETPGVSLGDRASPRPLRTVVPPQLTPGSVPDPEAEAWAMDVEGDVLEPDGSPVPGAAVLVGKEDGSETRIVARSDALGHYAIRRVDGRLLLWAEKEERVPSDRHLLVSKDPERGLDLRLGNAIGTLVGRVLSFEGEPLARAEVTLLASLGGTGGFGTRDQDTLVLDPPPMRVLTADDGRFRLGHPRADRFWFLVHSEGNAPLLSRTQGVQRAREEIELTLPSPSTLEGRLLRPDGAVAADVRLGLVLIEPLPGFETTTNEAGRFRFERLPPSPYVLRLLEDPSGATASCFVRGELEAGKRSSQEVTLAEEHTIHGRAFDGVRPLGDRIVELEEKGLGLFPCDPRRVRTAPDGGFAFPSCALDCDLVIKLLGGATSDRARTRRSSCAQERERSFFVRASPGGFPAAWPGASRATFRDSGRRP